MQTLLDQTAPRLAELRAEHDRCQQLLQETEQRRTQLITKIVGLEHTIQYLERLGSPDTLVEANGQGG